MLRNEQGNNESTHKKPGFFAKPADQTAESKETLTQKDKDILLEYLKGINSNRGDKFVISDPNKIFSPSQDEVFFIRTYNSSTTKKDYGTQTEEEVTIKT